MGVGHPGTLTASGTGSAEAEEAPEESLEPKIGCKHWGLITNDLLYDHNTRPMGL